MQRGDGTVWTVEEVYVDDVDGANKAILVSFTDGEREAGSMGRWQDARGGWGGEALNLPEPVTKCRFQDSKGCQISTTDSRTVKKCLEMARGKG